MSFGLFQSLSFDESVIVTLEYNLSRQVKLFDHLSDPHGPLINQISSETCSGTSQGLDDSCFICVCVHELPICIPSFCKKGKTQNSKHWLLRKLLRKKNLCWPYSNRTSYTPTHKKCTFSTTLCHVAITWWMCNHTPDRPPHGLAWVLGVPTLISFYLFHITDWCFLYCSVSIVPVPSINSWPGVQLYASLCPVHGSIPILLMWTAGLVTDTFQPHVLMEYMPQRPCSIIPNK